MTGENTTTHLYHYYILPERVVEMTGVKVVQFETKCLMIEARDVKSGWGKNGSKV